MKAVTAGSLALLALAGASIAADYLDQKLPGAAPEVFAPGIVSGSGQAHMAPAFSADGSEVFWLTHPVPPAAAAPDRALTSRRTAGQWSAPKASAFDGMVAIAPDGKQLFFSSARPCPGAAADSEAEDIWVADKTQGGWSAPQCLGLAARFPELKFATAMSVARNGTLYFLAHMAGTRFSIGIYRSRLAGGHYAKPEPLPGAINMAGALNWMPFISPDERFLLFASNRPGALDTPVKGWPGGDIHISRQRADGGGSDPVNLGPPVNSTVQERLPGMTPDGRYLFFTRPVPGRD